MQSGNQLADVVIIGGGIIGLAIAYQVARRSDLRVVLLDKSSGVGEGSTGASSAVLRHRYSFDEMVALARDGVDAYREWPAFTGLTNPRAVFEAAGVLWMPGDDGDWASVEHRRMQSLGVPSEVLDDRALAKRFPAFNPCRHVPDVETGVEHGCEGGSKHFFEPSGGFIDPVAAADDLVEASLREGVDVRYGANVAQVRQLAGAMAGVTLNDGTAIDSPCVVNAAGPWCNDIFQMLEIECPWTLAPTRIQVLYLDRPPELIGAIPVSIDMVGGVYFRLQNRGQQLVVGSTLESDEREQVANPDEFNRFVDDEFSRSRLHALHHRLPALPYKGSVRGYCGLYTVNREDVHPIVGRTPVDGFLVAVGFSGHGFKLAPAVGSLIAQLITGQQLDFDTAVSPAFLSFDRQPLALSDKSVLA